MAIIRHRKKSGCGCVFVFLLIIGIMLVPLMGDYITINKETLDKTQTASVYVVAEEQLPALEIKINEEEVIDCGEIRSSATFFDNTIILKTSNGSVVYKGTYSDDILDYNIAVSGQTEITDDGETMIYAETIYLYDGIISSPPLTVIN